MAPSKPPRRFVKLLASVERFLKAKSKSSTTKIISDIGIPLTFGIEVECYVALDWHTKLMLRTGTIQEHLRQKFDAADLSTTDGNAGGGVQSYAKWIVTYDTSLTDKFGPSNLPSKIPHMAKAAGANNLAVSGVELISRPMPVPSVFSPRIPSKQPQLLEISNFMDVLRGEMTDDALHAAFVSETCGLHIHFGRPDNSLLPLGLLRHLAYLQILYESTINKFHSYHRTPYPGTSGGYWCKSNKQSFLTSYHTCYKYRECLLPLAEIRRRIFDPKWDLHGLAWLMGTEKLLDAAGHERKPGEECRECIMQAVVAAEPIPCRYGCGTNSNSPCPDCWFEQSIAYRSKVPNKYKIVNWYHLVKYGGAHTIEFRQPAGTIDPEEIGWTVQLYTALIREAERRANANLGEFSFHESQIPTDIQQLLDLLRLPTPAKEYWTARAARLAIETFSAGRSEEQLTASQICSECAKEEWQAREAARKRASGSRHRRRPIHHSHG